jgi:hypothetical protein
MPVEGDPHGAEESFGADDVEDEAPFRDEHPVGEEGAATEHPLEGGQTDAVDDAQEERAQGGEPPGSA